MSGTRHPKKKQEMNNSAYCHSGSGIPLVDDPKISAPRVEALDVSEPNIQIHLIIKSAFLWPRI